MSSLASDRLDLAADRAPANTAGPARARALAGAAVLLPMALILAIACLLRGWGLDAPFASSDQVSMPHFVRHGYGVKWLFAHSYGPIPAIVARSFAELLSWFRLPIGEVAARLPILLVSTAQVMLTYPLMRRTRCSRNQALLGSVVCALLPPLVTDGHYAWGYLTIWLFLGTVSLWATLAYLDDRRAWQLVLAAVSLLGHCLSNCFAFGLPLTLLVVWLLAIRRAKPGRNRLVREAILGFVVPCIVAAGVLIASWLWTGQGQIGRLLAKQNAGATGWSAAGMLSWSQVYLRQMGYVFWVPAAAGLVYGLSRAIRAERSGLLALWACTGFLPLVFLSNPSRIGYPGAYLLEAAFATGMLAVVLAGRCWEQAAGRSGLRTMLAGLVGLALLHLAAGSVDACLAGGRLYRWTGVATGWGSVAPDTGMKAAGLYIRQFVPMEAVVMPLHTNRGMEAPVAEYYLGRRVVAGLDLSPRHVQPLLAAMAAQVDVVIAEPEQQGLVESVTGFAAVCTINCQGQPVRLVYARPGLRLPEMRLDTEAANVQYDRLCTPRHVPQPLPAPPGLESVMAVHRQTLQRLKANLEHDD
jgi:hypothetical protein